MRDAPGNRQSGEQIHISHAALCEVTLRSYRFVATRCWFGGGHDAGGTARARGFPASGRCGWSGRGPAFTRPHLRLSHRHHLRLQPRVFGLHGIEPPLQQTCLMACVPEFGLQRLDSTAMVRLPPVGPLGRLIKFFLQLRGSTPLAIDLQQRALFRRTQAFFGALRALP